MSTTLGPYANTILDSLGTGLLEATLTASAPPTSLNIGDGISANVEVFNGEIPGPTFNLTVGDTVIVRLINNLPYPLGIHWHGIELANHMDGTEVTQSQVAPFGVQQILGATAGGTFLYKFKVTRAGLFWYHPHHGMSMNRVFRGMYGLIIVRDPALENPLTVPGGLLPQAADTVQVVLSDITVCGAAPNPARTYPNTTLLPAADQPEWLMPPGPGAPADPFVQIGTTPDELCDLPNAKNDDGTAALAYGDHDVPSLMGQGPPAGSPIVEGRTVLTNGVNVGGRNGKPLPGQVGTLLGTAVTRDVQPGQGLRLQIVNCAHLRYFRLRLTRQDGTQVNLFRVGGEGGLLDHPILEGGTIGTGFVTGYSSGEILLPPATRADVVVAIPNVPGTVLTLWTRDFQRTGQFGAHPSGWAQLPTVPVMHLNVTGAALGYTIGVATTLRSGASAVVPLPAANDILFVPAGKTGSPTQDIQLTTSGLPRFDNVDSALLENADYFLSQHVASTRYAKELKVLELSITNASSGKAHHPFHLHGFSFQPIRLEPQGAGTGTIDPWPFNEFRDTIEVPPDHRLTFRVRLDDRKLADGATDGGNLGRWLFHCHLFFHHMRGMVGELTVVSAATSKEKPDVSVGGSWVYTPVGGVAATREGRFRHPDGLNITSLVATTGGAPLPHAMSLVPTPALPTPNGTWTWTYTSVAGDPDHIDYVYITATDSGGRKDQAVFRLQIGGADQGGDHGDPHIYTVDGKRYDFQAAGEFVLLRDLLGMEIQTRQTPAVTPPPIKDDYSGLTECVSLNTAAAARVGLHTISYQPWTEPGRLQFFLDGKPAELPRKGLDLGAHHVSTFDAAGEIGIRIDYGHGAVVTITPRLWTSYGIRYIDVDVSNTDAEQGLMGPIPKGTWLPALPSGATLGPMPANLPDRYVALYKTFADAWRVTEATTMFMYTPTKSTATYTDRDWPPQKPPCATLKPGFQEPLHPIKENIPIARAKHLCKGVTVEDLHAFCVFDVATTGDESFAKNYLLAQEQRLRNTAVQIVGNKTLTKPRESLVVTATVLPRTPQKKGPTGSVTFIVDTKPVKPPKKLDKHGRAVFTIATLKLGEHKIRATYSGGGEYDHYSSSSPNLLHTVTKSGRPPVLPLEEVRGTIR